MLTVLTSRRRWSAVRNLVLTISICFFSLAAALRPAHAYMAFMQTGNIPEPDHYLLNGHLQFAASGIDGVTLAARGEGRLTESSTLFGSVGLGAVKFLAGFGLKWVPYPDYDQQPALGSAFSVWYGYSEWQRNPSLTSSEVSLRISPFASKKYEVEFGEMNAYISLPFGVTTRSNQTRYPVHFVVGFESKGHELKQLSFNGEVGLNIHDAFNYFTVGATYEYSPDKGWVWE